MVIYGLKVKLFQLDSLARPRHFDLRDVKTETKIEQDKAGIIRLFENLLNKIPSSKSELNQNIYPTTKVQYQKGL